MKHVDLAKNLDVTPQWWCAIVRGRADAGKELAQKASAMIGGTIDIWMLKKKRTARKGLVESYLAAFRKAHRGN